MQGKLGSPNNGEVSKKGYQVSLVSLVLFTSLVLPNFVYGLPVYGASEPDLNIIQNFLDRCHKRHFISYPVSIKDLLKKQDCKIFKEVTSIIIIPASSIYSYKESLFL